MEDKRIVAKSRLDAAAFNRNVIRNWKPKIEVWSFAYGNDVLAILTAASGSFIGHYFRKELKIRPYARLSCYVPVMGLSACLTYLYHAEYMTARVLEVRGCPICLTTQAVIGQFLCGVVYPMVMAPVVCFYVADRLLTYPIPPLRKAPGEVFRLYFKLLKKNPRPYFVMTGIHVFIAALINFEQQRTYMRLLHL